MKLLQLIGLCTKNILSQHSISMRSEMLSVFQRQDSTGYWGKRRAVRAPALNASTERKSGVFRRDGSQADATDSDTT